MHTYTPDVAFLPRLTIQKMDKSGGIHMTAGAVGEERPTLFLRKATGLVRRWSVRDSLIYACLATNFVTLRIYEFTFAGPAFPQGQLMTAVIISGIWVSFLVIAYT